MWYDYRMRLWPFHYWRQVGSVMRFGDLLTLEKCDRTGQYRGRMHRSDSSYYRNPVWTKAQLEADPNTVWTPPKYRLSDLIDGYLKPGDLDGRP
jgi:hypothetical protein